MDLNKLYDKQAELDKHILENNWAREGKKMSKEELLDNTILALLVEVGELANTTRCFKHWSTKGMMDKEIVLDEFSDCLHFYLSIGNQGGIKLTDADIEIEEHTNNLIETFLSVYYWINEFDTTTKTGSSSDYHYRELGSWLNILGHKLGFTDEEVEQAYLKKHEENYKRQREGY